jgi:SAM-dependent methyltransferase
LAVDTALRQVIERFPFADYMDPASGGHANIARTVLRHCPVGSRILDFGCGPCDKTAILQLLGYRCTGCDDLQDYWHGLPGNTEAILSFASDCGIDFVQGGKRDLQLGSAPFDMVMFHDVLEHLHDSPRDLLNDILELAKPEGLLFVTVPNAVNIRKRLAVLFGKTNLSPFESYYWYPGSWRGHVREYVRDDLAKLTQLLDLEVLELRGCDHMLHKLPSALRPVYLVSTALFDSLKDSWLLVAKKKPGWKPMKELPKPQRSEFVDTLVPHPR